MTAAGRDRPAAPADSRHYRELFRHTLARLLLLYFMPLMLLAVFFHLQFSRLSRDGARARLTLIAEHQAATFDLFLRERLVNLTNIIDDPQFASHALDRAYLADRLAGLRRTNDAFTDLGVVSSSGRLEAHVGPISFPAPVTYRYEGWFHELLVGNDRSIISEIYLGFRGRPHFTLAVKRTRRDSVVVLRSTLSPERLAEYLSTLEGAGEAHAAVVSARGALQVATPLADSALQRTQLTPPREPPRGFAPRNRSAGTPGYAYAWLRETPWALVVTDARGARLAGLPGGVSAITVAFFALGGLVLLIRTRQLVGQQLAAERHNAELARQLVQAAKLASVGEFAAGIASEIDEPLGTIAETLAVLKGSRDATGASVGIPERLQAADEAVLRCRTISGKLLGFVRQAVVKLQLHDLHALLDDVLDGVLGTELARSHVTVHRQYDPDVAEIRTDRAQLVQVFINLVTNALDAMGPDGGTLTVTTEDRGDRAAVKIADTGCGIAPDQLEQIFMPLYTTKHRGRAAGLGLSVSYTILEHLGGTVSVDSAPGRGTTFTVELPYQSGGASSTPTPP
jgi:two-component system NtrC family sensor kinase